MTNTDTGVTALCVRFAGCTLDDEPDGCAGIELRHEGDPTDCVREWGGCNHCGVHEQ